MSAGQWFSTSILTGPYKTAVVKPHPRPINQYLWGGAQPSVFFSFLVKILCIYLAERESTRGGEGAEGEAGFPRSREPYTGLIPEPWNQNLNCRQMLHRLLFKASLVNSMSSQGGEPLV